MPLFAFGLENVSSVNTLLTAPADVALVEIPSQDPRKEAALEVGGAWCADTQPGWVLGSAEEVREKSPVQSPEEIMPFHDDSFVSKIS